MPEYPLIADHGLVGDLQTAALVSTDGTVDWLCLPRFDSPSVFGALLDADGGGYFRIAPEGDDHVTRQLYLPDTAILVTRFMSPDGVGELIDFMPPTLGTVATDRRRLVRGVRVVRGRMRFVLDCSPRFDYGRAGSRARGDRGPEPSSGPAELARDPPRAGVWSVTATGVRASFELDEGEYCRRDARVGGR